MTEKIYSVSKITSEIKNLLRKSLPSPLKVIGEISNYKLHSSGHLYFSLKDDKALIKAVMFNAGKNGIKFQDGDQVICDGYIGLYEPYGSYQIIVGTIEKSGQGELYRQFLKIKEKLQKMGYFDNKHKRDIPQYPMSIGIITSSTGAVIRDISNVLKRRAPYIKKYLYPAKVQGESAYKTLINGIEFFNTQILPDVIIIGRGGGSMEDLWEFNNENLANAVFNSKVPVISAVGHETDFTIIDFVADKRAPTPSAAAEIAVRDINDIRMDFEKYNTKMTNAIRSKHQNLKTKIDMLKRNFYILSIERINSKKQFLDQKSLELSDLLRNLLRVRSKKIELLHKKIIILSPSAIIARISSMLTNSKKAVLYSMNMKIRNVKIRTENIEKNLENLNPLTILNRGYSIVYNNKNDIIKSYNNVETDEVMNIRLKDGRIFASVIRIQGTVVENVEKVELKGCD